LEEHDRLTNKKRGKRQLSIHVKTYSRGRQVTSERKKKKLKGSAPTPYRYWEKGKHKIDSLRRAPKRIGKRGKRGPIRYENGKKSPLVEKRNGGENIPTFKENKCSSYGNEHRKNEKKRKKQWKYRPSRWVRKAGQQGEGPDFSWRGHERKNYKTKNRGTSFPALSRSAGRVSKRRKKRKCKT